MRAYPPALVDQLLDTAGRRERRQRLLPARLMVYFTLCMWIFGSHSYEEVLDEILWGLPGLAQTHIGETASAAAIGRARQRLGVEPLRLLFEQGAAWNSQVTARQTADRWRVLQLDSSLIQVPDTPANRLEFGAPEGCDDATRNPCVPMSMLTDGRTNRVLAATIGTEPDLAFSRWAAGPGTLVLMDGLRAFSPAAWTTLRALEADHLWPISGDMRLPAETGLSDGSYLARLVDADAGAVHTVRVVRCGGTRLVTSIVDHSAAPADILTGVHMQHWNGGQGFGGFKPFQSGDRLVLRSKSPDLVRQELYAMLCVHQAIGDLVAGTAVNQ